MTLLTAPGLVITPAYEYEPHHPLLSWDNQVAFGSVVADSAATGYPASNLANPGTHLSWRSASTAEQLVTVSNIDAQSDHVALARHNLGSAGVLVSVEGITADIGASWEELFSPALLGTDAPHLLRFEKGWYVGLRLRLVPDATAPEIAVLFAGELIAVKPGVQPGYVPLTRADDITGYNGTSTAGEYLGGIVSGAALRSTAEIRDIDPDYYVDVLDGWVRAANRFAPFFWVWSPSDHPSEVAYAWLSSTAKPVVSRSTGQIDLSLDMEGLAL